VRRLRSFGEFLWDFVVGDDWITFVGIVLALALTALLAETTDAVWWILPLTVLGLLGHYVWRVARAARGS
jgi:hypothetical protein